MAALKRERRKALTASESLPSRRKRVGDLLEPNLEVAKPRVKKKRSLTPEPLWVPSRKHAGTIYGKLSDVVNSLDKTARKVLAEIETLPIESRKGRTIQVDAAAFLSLFDAHVAATEFRDIRARKAAQANAESLQQQLDMAPPGNAHTRT